MFRLSPTALCLSLACIAQLCACSTTNKVLVNPRDENVFTLMTDTGPKVMVLDTELMKTLRGAWTPGSAAITKTSKLDADDRQWVLDQIALIPVFLHQCRQLNLESIQLFEPGTLVPDFEKYSGNSKKYAEIWQVRACAESRAHYIDDSFGIQLRVFSKPWVAPVPPPSDPTQTHKPDKHRMK